MSAPRSRRVSATLIRDSTGAEYLQRTLRDGTVLIAEVLPDGWTIHQPGPPGVCVVCGVPTLLHPPRERAFAHHSCLRGASTLAEYEADREADRELARLDVIAASLALPTMQEATP